MNDRAVAIVGRGAVLSTGTGAHALWTACRDGASGARPLVAKHIRKGSVAAFAGIPEDLARVSGLAVPARLRRYCSPAATWGIDAARQAIDESGLSVSDKQIRWGLYTSQSGYTHPSVSAYAESLTACKADQGIDRVALVKRVLCTKSVDPFLVLKSLTNGLLGVTSLALGLSGESAAYTEGVTGNHAALSNAHQALMAGRIDAALVVSSGSDLDPLGLRMLVRDGAISCSSELNMRAFDRNACGAVAGEGAVAFVLKRSDEVSLPHWQLKLGTCHPDAEKAYRQVDAGEMLVMAGSANPVIDGGLASSLPRSLKVPITGYQLQTGLLTGPSCLAGILLASECLAQGQITPYGGLEQPVTDHDFVMGESRSFSGASAFVLNRDSNGVGAAYHLSLKKHVQ